MQLRAKRAAEVDAILVSRIRIGSAKHRQARSNVSIRSRVSPSVSPRPSRSHLRNRAAASSHEIP